MLFNAPRSSGTLCKHLIQNGSPRAHQPITRRGNAKVPPVLDETLFRQVIRPLETLVALVHANVVT